MEFYKIDISFKFSQVMNKLAEIQFE